MEWKLVATTFVAIFLAEMGDKTQLAAFALAGGSTSKWAVFAGASLALIATTAIAVVAGSAVGRYVPEIWLKRGAGVMFIAIGALFLIGSLRSAPPSPDTESQAEATELSQ